MGEMQNNNQDKRYSEALACIERQEHDEALRLLDGLLLDEPRNPQALYARALTLIAAGDYRKAGCSLLRSIVLDPGHVPSRSYLGFVQLTLGKEDSALSTLKTALEIDPGYVEAWCVLGDVYLDLGEYDEAKDAFEAALQLEPENPEPHRKMAMYLVSRGDMEGLREVCATLGKLDPSMAEQIQTLFFDEQ
ncbi:MAG: tetratricopeptide repeat protein [Chlorobium sp.]|nr:tetratricopeptide repeat protein [Chlorobium sp.]